MFRFIFWVSFVLEGFRFVINWIFQVGSSFPKKKDLESPAVGVFFPWGFQECLHLGCWTKVLFSLVTACLCLFLHDDAAFVINSWLGQPLGASDEMMSRQEQVDKNTSIQHLWTHSALYINTTYTGADMCIYIFYICIHICMHIHIYIY